MKRLLCLIPLVCISCARAADVKFAWDIMTPAPSGVELRIMDDANVVIQTHDCGPALIAECLVPTISPGSRKAQAFAYQVGIPVTIKEYSDGSNIVPFTVPVKSTSVPTFRLKIPQ